MNEAISKAKRCELCPPDEETCYCYDDKPSVYLTESQLDEIVKEFVKPAVSEDDRRLKMTVLSLVSDLRNCRAELAEERAAHNAHVTELCQLEEENRKLREELKRITELYEHAERDVSRRAMERDEARQAFVKATTIFADEMQRHQKAENELRRDFDEELEQFRKERDKLIEGLRWYADEENQKLDESTRHWENVYSPYEMDGGQRAREILEEIGVTVE